VGIKVVHIHIMKMCCDVPHALVIMSGSGEMPAFRTSPRMRLVLRDQYLYFQTPPVVLAVDSLTGLEG